MVRNTALSVQDRPRLTEPGPPAFIREDRRHPGSSTRIGSKPTLVVQAAFASWIGDGLLREVSFMGVRDDRLPAGIVRESGPRRP